MTKQRSGRFAVISVAAVFDHRLSNADIRVLAALGAHTDKNGRCWPATTTLANSTGMSERHVRTCLRNLECLGYVETESRPGQSSIFQVPRNSTSGVEPNPGTILPVPRNHTAGDPGTVLPPNNTKNNTNNNDAARYAFEGQVIRLNEKDLETWRQRYHAIPDLEAELAGLDSWYAGVDPKKGKSWFHRAQGSLNKKHQERLAARQGPGGGDYDSDVIH